MLFMNVKEIKRLIEIGQDMVDIYDVKLVLDNILEIISDEEKGNKLKGDIFDD